MEKEQQQSKEWSRNEWIDDVNELSSSSSYNQSPTIDPNIINNNVLVTRNPNVNKPNDTSSSSNSYNNKRRIFRSGLISSYYSTSGLHNKVTLEIPLQYIVLSGNNSDNPSNNKNGLSTRQISRLAINTSFHIYKSSSTASPYHQQQQRQNTHSIPTGRWIQIPDITCHISILTALRGRTGYTTGSVNVQYRFDHIIPTKPASTAKDDKAHKYNKNKIESSLSSTYLTTKQPIIQRWTTTINTGIGLNNESNNRRDMTKTNPSPSFSPPTTSFIPWPLLRLGVCTNISHHQSSTTSISINLQSSQSQQSQQQQLVISNLEQVQPNKFMVPPIQISFSNQFNISSLPICTKTISSINVRSQCTTTTSLFDFTGNTTKPFVKLSIINTSITLTPSFIKNVSSNTTDSKNNTNGANNTIIQKLSTNIGFLYQPKMITSLLLSPSIGLSIILSIPNIIENMISYFNHNNRTKSQNKTNENNSNKLLDLSIQWKGIYSWHFSGWWTNQKKSISSSSSSSSLSKRNTSSSNHNNNNINSSTLQSDQTTRKIGIGVTMNKSIMNNNNKSMNNNSTNMNPFGLLSWIFTWTEGDFTLRIPILISTNISLSAQSIFYHQIFQLFYVTFLSTIIQDVIEHYFFISSNDLVKDESISEQKKDEYIIHRIQKARTDAILQQSFMERQAKIRTTLEVERNGLIIHKAIMYVSNSLTIENDDMDITTIDDTNKFDVTIPLQFWLLPNESKLILYGKRSRMLGFFDLASHVRQQEKHLSSNKTIIPDDTNNKKDHDNPPIFVNRLWVQYTYNGQMYEATFNDDVQIELPNV